MATQFRAKMVQLKTSEGPIPESQGRNMALTAAYESYSLEIGANPVGAAQEINQPRPLKRSKQSLQAPVPSHYRPL